MAPKYVGRSTATTTTYNVKHLLQNVANFGGHLAKGTLTSFSTERTLTIFSFAVPGTIKQAHSKLPKITRKKADALPN